MPLQVNTEACDISELKQYLLKYHAKKAYI